MTVAILNTNPLTMTSREIAELVESRHDVVKLSIERLAKSGVISQPPLVDGPKAANGVVEKHYLVSKRDSYVVVAQLCPEFTARLVDRWQELETKVSSPAFAIPTTLSAALRLAADQSDQIEAQKSQLAIAAPKVAALDLIHTADGMLNLQAAGKTLQQQPNKFIAWLRENGWIYKRPGSTQNCARAEKFNAGYLTTKAHTVIQPDGTERVREQVMVTPKGLAKLAGVFAQ